MIERLTSFCHKRPHVFQKRELSPNFIILVLVLILCIQLGLVLWTAYRP